MTFVDFQSLLLAEQMHPSAIMMCRRLETYTHDIAVLLLHALERLRITMLIKITNSGLEESFGGRDAVHQVRIALDEAADGPHHKIVVDDPLVCRLSLSMRNSLRSQFSRSVSVGQHIGR